MYIDVSTHLHVCRMDSSTLTLWTGPFPLKRVSFYYYRVLQTFLNFMQTV